VSRQQAAAASFPRDEALLIAGLLAFVAGYIEAYTWIVHHVFANAESANLIFLRVNMVKGEWQVAARYIPPLFAFVVGVVLASWLRWAAPHRAARISISARLRFCSSSLFCMTICRSTRARSASHWLLPFRPSVFLASRDGATTR
jgi:uncharacterized membrane protein YoaK (UPF0700 family)